MHTRTNLKLAYAPSLQRGWGAIAMGSVRTGEVTPQESAAEDTAAWLVTHGEEIGCRPPTVDERSRILGIEDYCQALGL